MAEWRRPTHTDSEGREYFESYDDDLFLSIWNSGGSVDARLSAIAAYGPGYVGAVEWARYHGFSLPDSGVAIAVQHMIEDASSSTFGNFVSPLIKGAIAIGGTILTGLALAPAIAGAGAAEAVTVEGVLSAAEVEGLAAGLEVGTASAGVVEAAAVGAMPAAVPLTAAELTTMGLVQSAPGVWGAAAVSGATSGLTAGAAGELARRGINEVEKLFLNEPAMPAVQGAARFAPGINWLNVGIAALGAFLIAS